MNKSSFTFFQICLGILLVTIAAGCDQKSASVVARLGSTDSITFSELKWAFENETKYGKTDGRKVNPYSVLNKIIDERIAADIKQNPYLLTRADSLQLYQSYKQRVRNKIVLDFVVQRKILTDRFLTYYYDNQGSIVTMQYISIPYNDIGDGGMRNRRAAAFLADSIVKVATAVNFQNLIEKFSDIPGKSMHQVSKPIQLPIEALPVGVVHEMSFRPIGAILKPVEIKNGFIVGRVQSVEKSSAAGTVRRSKKEIELALLSKLEDTDYLTLDAETNVFHKALNDTYVMKFYDENIQSIYKKMLMDDGSLVNTSDVICTINHIGDITYKDVHMHLWPLRETLTSWEIFEQSLRDFLVTRVYEKIIIDSLEDGESWVRFTKEKMKRQLLISIHQNSNTQQVSTDSSILRRFYETHRELFTEPAYVLYSEIRCANAMVATKVQQQLGKKISFDKVAEELVKSEPALKTKLSYKGKLKQVSTKVRNYFTQIYSLDVGSFTTHPYQNSDGTLSFFKLIEKYETKFLPFDKVRNEVAQHHRSHGGLAEDAQVAYDYKTKHPVVIYGELVEKLNTIYDNE